VLLQLMLRKFYRLWLILAEDKQKKKELWETVLAKADSNPTDWLSSERRGACNSNE